MKTNYKNHQYKIVKSNGDLEVFSSKKFHRSLKRTGLRPKYCNEIAQKISKNLYPGIRTKDIYNQTFKLLKKHSTVAATHYSLKKALLELGPTGFDFEEFIAKYFQAIGFETYTGVVLQGEFVKHEVDVIASKKNYQLYTECKFHNNIRRKNDIKVVLYVKARWDDLKNGPDGKYLKGYYVASNTVFTLDAIQYAKGCGLDLLGVNAPEDESLLDKIKKYKIYPITSLKKLKKSYCRELIKKKILICSELLNEKKTMLKLGMSEQEIIAIFNDIQNLLES